MKMPLHAKEKLTHTLLKGIWNENGEFCAERISKPALVGPVPAVPKTANENRRFWFAEELWKMIGWEILGSEGQHGTV